MRWTGCGPGSCANSNHCDWQGKEPTFTATNAFRYAGRAPPATSPRTRLLQISECATHQDPTDSLLNSACQGGLQRPMTPGGATASRKPTRDRWGASSGYEASGTHTHFDEIPIDQGGRSCRQAPGASSEKRRHVAHRRGRVRWGFASEGRRRGSATGGNVRCLRSNGLEQPNCHPRFATS